MTDVFFYTAESGEYDDDLLKLIPRNGQDRINKILSPLDRKLSLYSELIVRREAVKKLGLKSDAINFRKNRHGKPYVLNDKDFYFNISHTGDALAVAVSEGEAGIDLEKQRNVDFDVLTRTFASSEKEYIKSSKNKILSFFEIWTKKEAYVKFTGEGLSREFSSFDVLSEELKNKFKSYFIGDYVLTLFSEKDSVINLAKLNEQELNNFILSS